MMKFLRRVASLVGRALKCSEPPPYSLEPSDDGRRFIAADRQRRGCGK